MLVSTFLRSSHMVPSLQRPSQPSYVKERPLYTPAPPTTTSSTPPFAYAFTCLGLPLISPPLKGSAKPTGTSVHHGICNVEKPFGKCLFLTEWTVIDSENKQVKQVGEDLFLCSYLAVCAFSESGISGQLRGEPRCMALSKDMGEAVGGPLFQQGGKQVWQDTVVVRNPSGPDRGQGSSLEESRSLTTQESGPTPGNTHLGSTPLRRNRHPCGETRLPLGLTGVSGTPLSGIPLSG